LLASRRIGVTRQPIDPAGRFRLDAAKLPAWHDGQLKAALKGGAFALVILGGSHDLTESLRGAYGRTCAYLRVSTERYREFAGEE
jgi:hypothetical protein